MHRDKSRIHACMLTTMAPGLSVKTPCLKLQIEERHKDLRETSKQANKHRRARARATARAKQHPLNEKPNDLLSQYKVEGEHIPKNHSYYKNNSKSHDAHH